MGDYDTSIKFLCEIVMFLTNFDPTNAGFHCLNRNLCMIIAIYGIFVVVIIEARQHLVKCFTMFRISSSIRTNKTLERITWGHNNWWLFSNFFHVASALQSQYQVLLTASLFHWLVRMNSFIVFAVAHIVEKNLQILVKNMKHNVWTWKACCLSV